MKTVNSNKLKFSSGMSVCAAILAAGMALAPRAEAIPFQGSTSGEFKNPTGASTLVTTGVGTSNFTWGTGYQSASNSLKFTGASFAGDVPPEQTFELGTLTYFNGTVLKGTEATSVDLFMTMAFQSPSGLSFSPFKFSFNLMNTPNLVTPMNDPANADKLFLTSIPSTFFTFGGVEYVLKIGFGQGVTGPGWIELDKFFVLEGSSASAKLLGTISAVTPRSVPDSGSTLALMAFAVAGVGGLRHYLNRKSVMVS
jgi:hypothetical protein